MDIQRQVGELWEEQKVWIISGSTAIILIFYISICIITLPKSGTILKKEIPENWDNIRVGLERASKENDPLLRELKLQDEATKAKKTVEDYRQLFKIYRKNKIEFLPIFPKHRWSILEWYLWFFRDVSSEQRNELLKNSFLSFIEKGALITGAIAFGRWVIEAPQRKKQEQYQAWQIIHLAKGEKVSGARKQALEDLHRQKASLAGLSAEKANLNGIDLGKADLSGAYLKGAYLKGAYLRGANLSGADLRGTDLREADLRGADLREADLRSADLREADLRGADLNDADLNDADLNGVRK